MLEEPDCPACQEQQIPSPLLFEASRLSGGAVLGLSRCPRCDTYFTRPRLAEHNQSTADTSYDELVRKYGPESESGSFHKDPNFARYLEIAESRLRGAGYSTPYRVCDVGAHCGFFLRFAQKRGWEPFGVEPSRPHARFARENNHIERLEVGYFDDASFPGETFHLITLLDVLEHVGEPLPLLRSAAQKLVPGGLILAKVPHVGFYLFWRRPVALAASLGLLPHFPTFESIPTEQEREAPRSGFLDLFEHVVHYDLSTARSVLGRAGFEEIEALPAPPTNPAGDRLNAARTLTYRLAKLSHALGRSPSALTHGLILVGRTQRLSSKR
jgi:SAM-dependent methyltransferase